MAKVPSNITRLVTAIRGEAAALSASRLPSESHLRHARTIAEGLSMSLPANAAESFSALQAFLDQHAGSFAALPPSPTQLAFAEKVAAEKGITLPEDARTQRGVRSAFLDVNAPKGKGATKPAARKKPAKKAKSKA